jgi:hypothetical protein
MGTAPPGLDEDSIAVMSVATPAAGEDNETYKTPNRRVYSLSAFTTLNIHESNNSCARQGYGGEPVDGSVSVRVHFG